MSQRPNAKSTPAAIPAAGAQPAACLRRQVLTPRERFLVLRADAAAPVEELAAFLLSTEVFWDKLDWALRTVLRGRYKDAEFRERVGDRACRAIRVRICKTRAREFEDRGGVPDRADDEFGAWVFGLCRFYADLACKKVLALRRRPAVRPDQGLAERSASPPTRPALADSVYARAEALVMGSIAGFEDPLRGVMEDDLAGLSRRESAARRGISENYVSQLRRRGRDALEALIREQVARQVP